MARGSRALTAIVIAIGTGFVGVTVAVAFATRAEFIPEARLPSAFVATELVCVAAVLSAAGVALRRHPMSSTSLSALVVAVCVPVWAGLPVLSPIARAWAAAIVPLAIPCAAAAAVLFNGRPTRRRSWVLISCAILAATATLVLGLGRNPALESECPRTCLNAPAVFAGLMSTPGFIGLSGVLSLAAAALGAAAVAVARALTSAAERTITAAALIVAGSAPLLATWNASLTDGAGLAPFLLAGVTASTVLAAAAREARARAWLRDSLDALREEAPDMLLVGRRRAAVHYAAPALRGGSVLWVDGAGLPIADEPEPDRTFTLTEAGAPSVRVVGSSTTGTAADLGDALTPAARLRLANARLTAVSRSRLRELRASQRRIVQASDAETHRIERDLHDGAQQRLVSSALYIEVARSESDGEDDLSEAAAAVRAATAGLRLIVHGTFATLLRSDGLDAAIDELRRTSAVAMVVDGAAGSLPEAVADAAYALAAAAVEAAGSDESGVLRLAVKRSSHALVVTLETPPPHDPQGWMNSVEDLADRVGALEGTLHRSARDGGWHIEAVIPCAS